MKELKELYLYPITGLYHECHDVNYNGLLSAKGLEPTDKLCLRELNNLWWQKALSSDTQKTILDGLSEKYKYVAPSTVQHKAILADPEKYLRAIHDAPKTIANLGAGAKEAFSALETLQIFCNLYTDFISYPYALSLQEGLVLNELSSETLLKEALNPRTNPYLEFIKTHCLPVINEVKPNFLWIVGQIKVSTFAMAMLAKQANPNCHIAVTWHATEYYSLAKISKYLKTNTALFSVIDSIILDDFENTMPILLDAVQNANPLTSVPNLIFAKKNPESNAVQDIEITNTLMGAEQSIKYHTHGHNESVPISSRHDIHVDPSTVMDIKLWPNAKCYWDGCNFCAINRKYITISKNIFGNVEGILNYLEDMSDKGIEYMWSYDEAIPPATLGELAKGIMDRKISIKWQTRSKIDAGFTEQICNDLAKAGLKEIRLGLESASPRVLSIMGKHPQKWSLQLIESVVSNFHNSGISVHFPCIIGFPTETDDERQETLDFLQSIVQKYPSVTFNINLLGFDVASKLFDKYEDFGITSIRWPTPAKYFLGNLIDWDCAEVPFDYSRLDYLRNNFMRSVLYPWIPLTAQIPTFIFYRLSETSRATMVWKSMRSSMDNWTDALAPFDDDADILISSGLVISPPINRGKYASDLRYSVYDWKTHHTFECDEQSYELLKLLHYGGNITNILTQLKEQCPNDDLKLDYFYNEIITLYDLGIITQIKKSNISDSEQKKLSILVSS